MATEAQIQSAFTRGVRDILGAVRFGALRDAVSRGDYQAALNAVDIDDAAFDPLRAAIMETYAQGGVDAIRGTRWPVSVRWNSATPETERYAREVVGQNITWITDDMRASVRWTIGDGIALGRSNNRIALDIVGRIGSSGSREGGILGLNQMQAQWVSSLRQKLEAGEYVDRTLLTDRERRLIDRGALTAAQIERITQSYANRLLLSRGKTIARTERGLAINAGRMEGYRQAAQRTGIPETALVKEWRHEGINRRDRPTHLAANGQTVQGLNTPFNIGGILCQYPHDPSLPASEVVNCGCRVRVVLPRNWRSLVNG